MDFAKLEAAEELAAGVDFVERVTKDARSSGEDFVGMSAIVVGEDCEEPVAVLAAGVDFAERVAMQARGVGAIC